MQKRPLRASGSGAVLEAPAFVGGLDDIAVVGKLVKKSGGDLGVAEHARPFTEGKVGRGDNRCLLVKSADQVEQEVTAGLGEGQIAHFVEDQEVEPAQQIGHAPSSRRMSSCSWSSSTFAERSHLAIWMKS